MALLIKFVGQYGKHASAKNAGFAKDDVITEMDGKSTRLTESELFGDLLQNTSLVTKSKQPCCEARRRWSFSCPSIETVSHCVILAPLLLVR